MLELRGVVSGYGDARILHGIDLAIGAGEVATLMGRNGMGKTTLIRALMGLLPLHAGTIRFEGQVLDALPPQKRAQAGLGLVPEGRRVFVDLTVEENLVATAAHRFGPPRWTLPAIYAFFPRLGERRSQRAGTLSGGEQQMLAIGRALMTNPRLLILDEATEGLAPLIRAEIWRTLATLKREGQAILVIDKNVEALLTLADRHAIIDKGRLVWRGTSAEFAADPGLRDRFLHI